MVLCDSVGCLYVYNQKTLGQVPKKTIPEFGQLLLLRTKRENKFQDRAELGIMMGLYPQIPHGIVAVAIQRNKTISEVYTAQLLRHTWRNLKGGF